MNPAVKDSVNIFFKPNRLKLGPLAAYTQKAQPNTNYASSQPEKSDIQIQRIKVEVTIGFY
jgi:hypothetical protein